MSIAPISSPAGIGLSTLDEAVQALEERFQAALAHVRDAVAALGDGKVTNAAADAFQPAIYDLAFSRAELSAARAMVDYARAAEGRGHEARALALAGAFVAEVLANFRHRIGSRALDYGMTREAIDAPFAGAIDAALQSAGSAAALEALGAQIAAGDGDIGPVDLPDEKQMMADTFRRFADAVVAPLASAIHREDLMIPDAIIDGVRDLGCFGLSVPERFGGLLPDDGEDSLGMIVATEELSRASLGAAGSLITRPEIMARALLEGGTDAQKAEWLPRIAAGDPLVAISVTEPNTGSDVAAVALRATRAEGGWRLDGAKTWCTFAGKAGVILVLARTDPDPAAGHRGLSLFMVEKPSSDGHDFEHESEGGGRLSGRAIRTLGYRGMHSFEMFYDGFFVPDSHVVGGEAGLGKGFYYQMRGFSGGRIQTAARATGLMQAAFEAAVAWAGDRRVFGQAVLDYGLTREKIARMAMRLMAARLLTYEVGRMLDAGQGQMEASLVKLFACKAAEGVTREALQIHGGMGYAEETAVSRFWVDARVLSIFEGAEETLALKVVGRALLG
ncbi:MAG TPA: acyl-CoA dehydrogenase family protein [Pseudomonadales bacterium]|nr:acyl-CoA dehydrogenase family protein [Pseudomonadales bacterium]